MLLRRLQRGESLALPHSRPMPVIGPRCHELRIRDRDQSWRILYRTDTDAVVVAEVWNKTTRTTPRRVITEAKRRLRLYDNTAGDEE